HTGPQRIEPLLVEIPGDGQGLRLAPEMESGRRHVQPARVEGHVDRHQDEEKHDGVCPLDRGAGTLPEGHAIREYTRRLTCDGACLACLAPYAGRCPKMLDADAVPRVRA